MYKGCYNSYKFDMTDTHAIAYYGIDTKDFTFIKNSYVFNRRTNLEGSADADLAERVVGAISSFGVNGVQVESIECGPVVTRVNLKLPYGVRSKTVADLSPDIAMQLHVKSVSATPVPEKGVLALDIPAKERKVIRLGNVHTEKSSTMALPLELGVSVTGEARAIDLAKAPHLLIAGQTGSGKSVCINSIICSLLRNVPLNDFDLMLVDPKGVELNDYRFVPNCINKKILVEPNESLDGLRWLCKEMDRRYAILTKYGHRNLQSYNDWVSKQPVGRDCVEKMRYVVCVVDEFADLMMTAGTELTAIVQRLAQKSRAVGIHLILATQRPSVKVVTGDLKANLPCRIAFKVSSTTDSVTILGHGGAERLLGMGDMILSNNDVDERLHGVYLDDHDIFYTVAVLYNTTVNSIIREVDFVNGKASNSLGVPSWLLETMSECGRRQLASGSPAWLTKLVDINRKVWDRSVDENKYTFATFMCRMAKYYGDVEAIRPLVASSVFGKAVSARSVGNVYGTMLDTMLRLPTKYALGLGYSDPDVKQALSRAASVNDQLDYLKSIA